VGLNLEQSFFKHLVKNLAQCNSKYSNTVLSYVNGLHNEFSIIYDLFNIISSKKHNFFPQLSWVCRTW